MASSASAIAKSNATPDLRMSAGARFTSRRPGGNPNPELTIAARTRSRDSLRARSASPTSVKTGTPAAESVSTRTTWASIPAIPAEKASASMHSCFTHSGCRG